MFLAVKSYNITICLLCNFKFKLRFNQMKLINNKLIAALLLLFVSPAFSVTREAKSVVVESEETTAPVAGVRKIGEAIGKVAIFGAAVCFVSAYLLDSKYNDGKGFNSCANKFSFILSYAAGFFSYVWNKVPSIKKILDA